MTEANFETLKKSIDLAEKAITELGSSFNQLENVKDKEEKKMVRDHLKTLKKSFKNTNENILQELEKINLAKPLQVPSKEVEKPGELKPKLGEGKLKQKIFMTEGTPRIKGKNKAIKALSILEKETIKRIKKGREKVTSKEITKPKAYSKIANKYLYNYAKKLFQAGSFETLKKDLIKTNLEYTPTTYFSLILFATIISVIVAFVVFLFLLFFKVGFESPIIVFSVSGLGMRFLQIFWILFLIPIATFGFMYAYPSLEKKSLEKKINREIPFSTIHMSAISQSMLEPSQIFKIILKTGEYPNIGKEFTKLINKINVYGYDLVTSLKSTALNSPSQKLRDLLNGLATTITSGGDLREFFEKRSQTLLFEHKLEVEKDTKSAETFMDVYISVVIAAPMILMLLLMMMKISGLGIALSTSSITLIIVLSVSLLNVIFLTFLTLKKSAT